MAEENKDTVKPKSKKSTKKKDAVSNTEGLTSNSASLSSNSLESDNKQLHDMLMLANIEYARIRSKMVREKRKEIDTLDSQIKEFLGPYMLIGYDLNNNPVEIISSMSPAENDALLERFRRVMYKINQNITSSNGEDPFGNTN